MNVLLISKINQFETWDIYENLLGHLSSYFVIVPFECRISITSVLKFIRYEMRRDSKSVITPRKQFMQ